MTNATKRPDKRYVGAHLDDDEYSKLEDFARSKDRSIASVVRLAISEKLKKDASVKASL